MLRFIETISILLLVWTYSVSSEDDSFSEITSNPPEHLYFAKYGPCSVSTGRLRNAYLVERQLVATIQKGYDNVEISRFEKKLSKDFEEIDEKVKEKMVLIIKARKMENGTAIPTDHPINTLHFLRRIVYHFNPPLNTIFTSGVLLKRDFYQDLSSEIDRYIRDGSACWPTAKDLQIAITGLARIINTYRLCKRDLIQGTIMGHQATQPLALDEIVALTQEANRNNYHSDVLDWTELLLNESVFLIKTNKNQWRSLVRMRATALFRNNRQQEAIDYLEEILKDPQVDKTLFKRDLNFFKSKSNEISDNREQKKKDKRDLLCRQSVNSSLSNNLRCFYRRNKDGWDRTKIELLNRNPPIYKYYGAIMKDAVKEVFNVAKMMKRKLDEYHHNGEVFVDETHSDEQTVIWDDDERIMKTLSKKISYITGLETNNHKYNTKLSSSGPFKIVNYGIGGFKTSEVDYLNKEGKLNKRDISVFGGDRLATWIYHLTEDFEGGRIVFPKVNLSIDMEQGTGLLWFNVKKNGKVNPLSENMECPVAFGSKWVIKKFIHENGNMFARKCNRRTRSYF